MSCQNLEIKYQFGSFWPQVMLYPADLSSKFSSFSSIGCHITVQKTCRLIQRESWLCRTCIWTLSLAVQTVSVLTLFYLFIYLFILFFIDWFIYFLTLFYCLCKIWWRLTPQELASVITAGLIQFRSQTTHEKIKAHHYSLKIICYFWLAQCPRLILHNQLALIKFGRWDQYTINSMV